MKNEIYEHLKEWRSFFTAREINSEFPNLSLTQIKRICRQLVDEGRVRKWMHQERWHYQFLS